VAFRRPLPVEPRLKNSNRPLFDFGFPPESATTSPSSPNRVAITANSSHGLWFPSARSSNEGQLLAEMPTPLCSAFRVWLPSWRLAPLKAWPGLFRPGSAPGILPFEAPHGRWLSPFDDRRTCLPLAQHDFPQLLTATSRCTGHRLPGFNPSASSRTARSGLGLERPESSRGVFPFQGKLSSALNGLPPVLPLRASRNAAAPTAAALRHRVSIGVRLACTCRNQRANDGESTQPS